MILRPLDWPHDRAGLLALDTSFEGERFYRLELNGRSMSLREMIASSPIKKSYSLINEVDALPTMSWVQIAEDDAVVVGLAAMRFEQWNRRARLEHLYVARQARGRGIGRKLVGSALQAARQLGARGVWVETQTINYDAIRFYKRAKFAWCGADVSLYDPKEVSFDEIALFFWRAVS